MRENSKENEKITLIFPPNGYVFNTHTDNQQAFIDDVQNKGIEEALKKLKAVQNGREFSYPNELVLEWTGTTGEIKLEISETPDFINAQTFECTQNSFKLTNCKTAQKYYWRVNRGPTWEFETASGIRFLHIEGLRNVRDLGGKNINQGLLFRGCEPEPTYHITEHGKYVATELLGIKTQLDLRLEFYGKLEASPIGDEVILKQIPYRPYKEIFEEKHKKAICEIIEFLSCEEHYPVYFHCMGGADRTGMIALFLKALAGEADEEIFLDYEVTSLARIPLQDSKTVDGFRSIKAPYFIDFLNLMEPYAPNGALKDKVPNFLRSCGVEDEWMKRIKQIIQR